MGCENSTSVIPITNPPTPSPTPSPARAPSVRTSSSHAPPAQVKENIKPAREPSFKAKEIFITSESQGRQEVKRKSKSESRTMEMVLAEVTNAGGAAEDKKKSFCQPPKTKSTSVNSPTEQMAQQELGPSSHSIALPDPPVPPAAAEPCKQVKPPPSRWVNHLEDAASSQAHMGSMGSEKVSIEPFKFQIFAEEHHGLAKTERERLQEEIWEEKMEVGRYLEQLAVGDEDLLQLVIQKIEAKEELIHQGSEAAAQKEFKGDGEWEMERMMQEELRQQELRMEKQLLHSMGVASTPAIRSPTQSIAP